MKQVMAVAKIQLPGGKASPAPPVGPALGQHGINIVEFCKSFNAKTAQEGGMIIPCVVTIYKDRSFTFITKTPPAAALLKRAAGIAKGSGVPNRQRVGTGTESQVEEIARLKMRDLNAVDVAGACRIVAGTARSMGIAVEGA